jgi:hypothetical protein
MLEMMQSNEDPWQEQRKLKLARKEEKAQEHLRREQTQASLRLWGVDQKA